MTPAEIGGRKIRLSSDSVSMYRVFIVLFGVMATMAGAIFAAFAMMDETPDWSTYLPAFGIVGVIDITAWYSFRRMNDVFYDDKFLYVETLFKQESYDLNQVRRINGPYLSRDRTFEIEFYAQKGSILKIDYLPPRSEHFHFVWKEELSGRSLAFARMLKEINHGKIGT